jgi:hypothetical protein
MCVLSFYYARSLLHIINIIREGDTILHEMVGRWMVGENTSNQSLGDNKRRWRIGVGKRQE